MNEFLEKKQRLFKLTFFKWIWSGLLLIYPFISAFIDVKDGNIAFCYTEGSFIDIKGNDTVSQEKIVLRSGDVLEQSFVAVCPMITSIVVNYGPDSTVAYGIYDFTLIEGQSGAILDKWEEELNSTDELEEVELFLSDPKKLGDMSGKSYLLQISESAKSREHTAAFYRTSDDVYEDGQLLLDDKNINGDLLESIHGENGGVSLEYAKFCLRLMFSACVIFASIKIFNMYRRRNDRK